MDLSFHMYYLKSRIYSLQDNKANKSSIASCQNKTKEKLRKTWRRKMEQRSRTYRTITSQPWYRFIRDIAGSRYAYGNRRRSFSGVIMRRRQQSLRPTSPSTGHRLLGSSVIRHPISRTTAAAGRRKLRQQWWANSKLICHLCWRLIMRQLIDWFIASPSSLCFIRHSCVCVLATFSKTTDWVFMKIWPEMYLLTRKSPLNSVSYPNPESENPDWISFEGCLC